MLSSKPLPAEAAWPDSCLGTGRAQQETETPSELRPESGQLGRERGDRGPTLPKTAELDRSFMTPNKSQSGSLMPWEGCATWEVIGWPLFP